LSRDQSRNEHVEQNQLYRDMGGHQRVMKDIAYIKLLIRGSWVRFPPRSPNKSKTYSGISTDNKALNINSVATVSPPSKRPSRLPRAAPKAKRYSRSLAF